MTALKPSTAGRQYAGWTPSTVAMSGLGQRLLADQLIPVADDAALHADVYLPKTEGRYPAVVMFGGYSTELLTAGVPMGNNEIGSPPVFTDRGYCPVVVERRGMGRSTGDQVPHFHPRDTDDEVAVIAWAAEQPWCNGEVVLFGTSYYGVTQLLAAERKPPALKAFFANEVCTDLYRHLLNFGGVPGLYFLNLWLGANFTPGMENLRVSPEKRALVSHLTNGRLHPLLEKVVHRKMDDLFTHFMAATPTEPTLRSYVDWIFDAKTPDHPGLPTGSSGSLDRIDIPFTVVQNLGYLNLHQYGTYDLWENASTPADRRWMILGPAEYDLPVYSWQGEALAFFDHVLRGTDNGYDAQPPVRYWVENAETFATATTFPPPSRRRKLFLGDGGTLSEEETAVGSDSWLAVPLGLPTLGGLDTVATQILTFDLPIEQDIRLAGAVTARLSFSCNEIDSYLVARLSRVAADGTRHQLSIGAVRPTACTEDPTRSTGLEIVHDTGIRTLLVPGEPVTVRFSLTPFPVLLQAGERLQLDLGSRSDLLREDPANGYVQFDIPAPPYLCRNTVHFGGESWIEVDEVTTG